MSRMNSDDVIEIQWQGLPQLFAEIKNMRRKFEGLLMGGMTDYSLLVEEGARALAQHFEGTLEERIVAAKVAYKNNMIMGSVGSNLVYAFRRHEEPYRMGSHPLYHRGAKLENYYKNGLGERSRQSPKGMWRGQMPGRKFLERAIVATEEEFYQMMDQVLTDTLKEGGF